MSGQQQTHRTRLEEGFNKLPHNNK